MRSSDEYAARGGPPTTCYISGQSQHLPGLEGFSVVAEQDAFASFKIWPPCFVVVARKAGDSTVIEVAAAADDQGAFLVRQAVSTSGPLLVQCCQITHKKVWLFLRDSSRRALVDLTGYVVRLL
jgi:hypothetical protein